MNGIPCKTNLDGNRYNLLKIIFFTGFLFCINIKMIAGPSNIAPLAKVSASAELDSACSSEKVIDGLIDIAGIGEWVSNSRENAWGEIDYPWIQFKWDQKHLMDKIIVYDRPEFNSDAFWLTQWNLNILWGLAWPEVLDDFSASLVQFADNGGLLAPGTLCGRLFLHHDRLPGDASDR